MTDHQLLSRFQSGDADALCQLISRHMPTVHAASLREVRDPHLADDITQAVFLVLARRAKSLPTNTILAGWLFRTTHYAAADARKMQIRRTHHEREAATMRSRTEQSTPRNDDIHGLLNQAIARLAPADRDAVVLRYLQDLPSGEVAAALGTSENTARQRVARALERLRKLLSRNGVLLAAGVLVTTLETLAKPAVSAPLDAQILSVAAGKSAPSSFSLALARGAMRLETYARLLRAALIGSAVAATGMIAFLLPQALSHFPARASVPPSDRPAIPIIATVPAIESAGSAPASAASPSVTAVAAGGADAFFIKSDGSLWGMGSNNFGQLGDGTTLERDWPVRVEPSDVVAVSTDGSRTLFIKRNGSLWGMGENSSGLLGDPAVQDRHKSVQIVAGDVTAGATRFGRTLYLKSDGSLWGTELTRVIGPPGVGVTEGAAAGPNVALVSRDVTAFAMQIDYVFFIKKDGSLWKFGQALGSRGGGPAFGSAPAGSTALAPGQDLGLEQVLPDGVTAISAGQNHLLILKKDRSLWAMGVNTFGQLGDGTRTQRNQPVQVVSADVIAIAAGHTSTYFIKKDATLWATGDDSAGALGDGGRTGQDKSTPLQVAKDVSAIASGNRFALFLKADGTLWSMGLNNTGQLGDGTSTSRNLPVRVQLIRPASLPAAQPVLVKGLNFPATLNNFDQATQNVKNAPPFRNRQVAGLANPIPRYVLPAGDFPADVLDHLSSDSLEYLVRDNAGQLLAVVILHVDESGNGAVSSSGGNAASMLGTTTDEALVKLAALDEIKHGTYEVRLLTTPPPRSYVTAFWLKSAPGGTDLFYVISNAFNKSTLEVGKLYRRDETLNAIRAASRQ